MLSITRLPTMLTDNKKVSVKIQLECTEDTYMFWIPWKKKSD